MRTEGSAMDSTEPLPPALGVALAWQPAKTRGSLEGVFAFDTHLARVVAQAREGILAQMRLAWWRDRLKEPPSQRPSGNPLLAAIQENLAGEEEQLIALVDGWEELLGEAPLPESAIAAFADGRAAALGAVARTARLDDRTAQAASLAGRRWALADFAFRTSDDREREAALALADTVARGGLLPRRVRGIAVLGALADRAIARREPLLTGRVAPLVALRVGITGR
jgi:15-cis-phytoene synthase